MHASLGPCTVLLAHVAVPLVWSLPFSLYILNCLTKGCSALSNRSRAAPAIAALLSRTPQNRNTNEWPRKTCNSVSGSVATPGAAQSDPETAGGHEHSAVQQSSKRVVGDTRCPYTAGAHGHSTAEAVPARGSSSGHGRYRVVGDTGAIVLWESWATALACGSPLATPRRLELMDTVQFWSTTHETFTHFQDIHTHLPCTRAPRHVTFTHVWRP